MGPWVQQEPALGNNLYQRDMAQLADRKQIAEAGTGDGATGLAAQERQAGISQAPTDGPGAPDSAPAGTGQAPDGRAAENPAIRETGGASQTGDGRQLENRSYSIRGTTNEDTKLNVDYKESENGERITTVRSDRAFESSRIARAEGEQQATTQAVERDGSYQMTFKGSDTVGEITLGDGNDTVRVSSESDRLIPGELPVGEGVLRRPGLVTSLGGGNDNYKENGNKKSNSRVNGGEGNDTIRTSGGDNIVFAGSGDDDVKTNGGGDSAISGGDGNDTIRAIGGNNTILGGSGDDDIKTGDGNDRIYGNAGNDLLEATGGNNEIYGGFGADDIRTGGGNDLVYGNDGDDAITTNGGNDVVIGGLGGDDIKSGGGNDLIYAGDFTASADTGAPLAEPITNEDGSLQDYLATRIDTGTNTVSSGGGDDRVYGSLAAGNAGPVDLKHVIDTGSGDDVVEVGSGTNDVRTGSGDDFVLGGAGNDTISGGEGKDTLMGVGGDDRLDGGGGDDIVAGGRGRDSLAGGGGKDKSYDFIGEAGTTMEIENSVSVDPTDYLGRYNFDQGGLTENAVRAVESVTAGQDQLRSIQDGRKNYESTTQVLDTGSDSRTGGNLLYIDRPESNLLESDSISVASTPVGEDGSRQRIKLGPDGLPVSGEGEAFDYVLGLNQETHRGLLYSGDINSNSVTLAAHELVHQDQFVNGNNVRGKTEFDFKNGQPVKNEIPNFERDAVGLPYDIDGDGKSDPESAERFNGRVGQSENSIRRSIGLGPRPSYELEGQGPTNSTFTDDSVAPAAEA